MTSREVCCQLKDTFAEADLDGDGRISRRKMEQILLAVTPLSPRDIDYLFRDFGTDGDGYLDYKEFTEWLAASKAEVAGSKPPISKFMWGTHVTVAKGPAKGKTGWLQEVMESEDKSLYRVSFNASGSDTVWTSEVAKARERRPELAPCEFTEGVEVVVAEGPAKGMTGYIHTVRENEYRRLYRVDFDDVGLDAVWTSEVAWPKPREQQVSSPSPAIGSGVASLIGPSEKNEGLSDFHKAFWEEYALDDQRVAARIEKATQEKIAALKSIQQDLAKGPLDEAAIREEVRKNDGQSHPCWKLQAASTKKVMTILIEALFQALAPGGHLDERKELAFTRAMGRGSWETIFAAFERQGTWRKISDEFCRLARTMSSTSEATGAELNDKFKTNPENGFEMVFGSKADFFQGLQELIGHPNPMLLLTAIKEHCCSCDSMREWTTGNYGITTMSFVEFLLVLQEVKKLCLRDAECERRFPAEWHEAAGFIAAAKAPLPALKDWPTKWPKETINIEHGRQPETQNFLQALYEKNKKIEELEERILTLEEGILLRLYTGPLFEKYNIVPRAGALSGCSNQFLVQRLHKLCGSDDGSGDVNRYVTSIHILSSGIVKLSKLTQVQMVYRGLGGNMLPTQFWVPDDFGCKGGVEFGLMSTTSNREVALRYSGDGHVRMVLEMEMGLVDRGADLRELSQYPEEAEILFGPLTSLEVRDTDTEGGVLVVKTRVNINLRSPTIDEVVSQRYQNLLRVKNDNLAQARRHFLSPEWKSIHRCGDKVEPLQQVVTKMMETPLSEKASFYNDDTAFLTTMTSLTQTHAQIRDFNSSILRELGMQLPDPRLVKMAEEREAMEVCKQCCTLTFKAEGAGIGDLWLFRALGLQKAQDGCYYPALQRDQGYRSHFLNRFPIACKDQKMPLGSALVSANNRRDLDVWAREVQSAWTMGVAMEIKLDFCAPRSSEEFASGLKLELAKQPPSSSVETYLLCNSGQQELDLDQGGLSDAQGSHLLEALSGAAQKRQLALEYLILGRNSLGKAFATSFLGAVNSGSFPRLRLLQLAENEALGEDMATLGQLLEAIAEQCSSLEVLNIGGICFRDDDDAASFVSSWSSSFGSLFQRLRTFQFFCNRVGPKTAAALAGALRSAATAAQTSRQSNHAAGETVSERCCKSVSIPLKRLWLNENPQLFAAAGSSSAFRDLMAALAASAADLEELRLAQTGLAGAEVVAGLAAALPSLGKLWKLSLYGNPALFSESDAAGIRAFTEGLGSCSVLEELWLHETGLSSSARASEALAGLLPKLPKLKKLMLHGNPGLDGAAKEKIRAVVDARGGLQGFSI